MNLCGKFSLRFGAVTFHSKLLLINKLNKSFCTNVAKKLVSLFAMDENENFNIQADLTLKYKL